MLALPQAANPATSDDQAVKSRIGTDCKTAKAACEPMPANDKDICVNQAKAVESKAPADAKMGKQIMAVGVDAAQNRHDADDQVAAEKCDAMTADGSNRSPTLSRACPVAASSRESLPPCSRPRRQRKEDRAPHRAAACAARPAPRPRARRAARAAVDGRQAPASIADR